MLGQGRDEEDIFILKGNIGSSAIHDALQINGEHLLGAVGFHTTHDST